MNIEEKIKSLNTIFDKLEPLELKGALSDEKHTELITKVGHALALAYDKGYKDGSKHVRY